ncbi:hypothetical protein AUR04nite_13350 [Glutamicibacter uratoxydans]|uniref:Uncharacterized protein n=1 Tax=Glutamicibacter uratoxydans TaxID=43667 RepID=A0A4Y4DMI5_GLUUR|nr:hypothetical protein AUR04nite_13350 [Glutamicibacter uratoxydans]
MALVCIIPCTHWINGWFLRLFSVPVISIDAVEHTGVWGKSSSFEIADPSSRISVGARYRGSSQVLGRLELQLQLEQVESMTLRARNGLLNHEPFKLSVISQECGNPH